MLLKKEKSFVCRAKIKFLKKVIFIQEHFFKGRLYKLLIFNFIAVRGPAMSSKCKKKKQIS